MRHPVLKKIACDNAVASAAKSALEVVVSQLDPAMRAGEVDHDRGMALIERWIALDERYLAHHEAVMAECMELMGAPP